MRSGMIAVRGGSYARVHDRPAAAGLGRTRSRTGYEGHRDCGTAPPGGGAAPAGRPAAIRAVRPADPGGAGAAAATAAVDSVPGHARDVVAVAPGVGGRRWTYPATGRGGRCL